MWRNGRGGYDIRLCIGKLHYDQVVRLKTLQPFFLKRWLPAGAGL